MEYQKFVDFEDDNISKHPYIISLGLPTSLISDSVMRKRIGFYTFKNDALDWLSEMYNKSFVSNRKNILGDYKKYKKQKDIFTKALKTIDDKALQPIDRAVSLGIELDYEKMLESFKKVVLDDLEDKKQEVRELNFYENFDFLRQICKLKNLESSLLYLLRDDIDKETNVGSISLLTSIQNSTNSIYVMAQTPFVFLGEKNLEDEVDNIEFQIKSKKELSLKEKEAVLDAYANLPMLVLDNVVDTMVKSGVEEDKIQNYVNKVSEFLGAVVAYNDSLFEPQDQNTEDEQTQDAQQVFVDEDDCDVPYKRDDDFKDPMIG